MPPVYLDCSPFLRDLFDDELHALAPELEIHMGDPDEAKLRDLLRDAPAVLNGHTSMPRGILEAAPALRSVIFLGTGASSYVDMATAGERGIRVRIIKGYGDRSVAEHAFALMLAAARQVAAMDRAMHAGEWAQMDGIELEGKTLGVLGTGGTGRELACMAEAFGMRVVAWNRSGVPKDLPCEAVPIEALLAQSDVLSLHLALTGETRGFLDAARLALLKPGAILVNTARGALVDEAALIEALRDGRVGHAALDVYDHEPLPPGHALRSLPNVTLTSHAAFKTPEASRRLLKIGLELLRADMDALAEGRALAE
jgi:D-3-phosphoglycerate dehydrogenase